MTGTLKTTKFWEIAFFALGALLVTPIFMEFLILTIIPLAVVGIVASVFAFKDKKYYLIPLNTLALVGAFALYIYTW